MISLWKKQTVMQDKSWLDQQQPLQTRIEGLFWPLYYHGNQYLAMNRHELVLQSLYWQYRSSGDYDKESLRGNQPIIICFSDSTQEPQHRDDDYDRLFKVRRIMNMVLSNFKQVYENTYACGTARCTRKDLPPCAKHKLRLGEMAQAQCGQLVFPKWYDKRDVVFLLTNVSPDEPS